MADTFRCTLVTPERQVLDDHVTYASIPAWDGLLGVEIHRAPLLVKLGDGPLRLDFPQGGSRFFFLAGGFAQMKDDKLSLLTTEAIAGVEIVHQDVVAAMKEAEARKAVTEQEAEKRTRDLNRGRALLALLEHAERRG